MHLGNAFGSPGGFSLYTMPADFFKDGSTPRRLSARVSASIPLSIATLRRAHASADFADLDRPSYFGPSPSGECLYKLSLVFDGGDHETFSRGSREIGRASCRERV